MQDNFIQDISNFSIYCLFKKGVRYNDAVIIQCGTKDVQATQLKEISGMQYDKTRSKIDVCEPDIIADKRMTRAHKLTCK